MQSTLVIIFNWWTFVSFSYRRLLTSTLGNLKWNIVCASDSALADHCARLQIIFTYLLTYLQYCITYKLNVLNRTTLYRIFLHWYNGSLHFYIQEYFFKVSFLHSVSKSVVSNYGDNFANFHRVSFFSLLKKNKISNETYIHIMYRLGQ